MDNDNKELTNKARKRTQTQSFGASKREGHDSTKFYNRKLYNSNGSNENAQYDETPSKRSISKSVTAIYANDIVQIDLTIIAGLVIFLVLTNVFEFGSQAFQNKAFLILLLAVIPFSISAVLVVFENVKQGKSCEKYPFKWFALAFTTGGFLYLIAKVIMLSVDSF